MVSKIEEKELKRHYKPDNTNITVIHGCFVSIEGEIISTFSERLSHMTEDVLAKYMDLFRKVLGGKEGISRSSLKSDNTVLLDSMIQKSMKDEDNIEEFFREIIAGTSGTEIGPFLILTACDSYDIPGLSSDGIYTNESEGVFSHLICAVCPIKDSKPVLSFTQTENKCKNILIQNVAANPIAGIMYPDYNYRMEDRESISVYYSKEKFSGIFSSFTNENVPSAQTAQDNISNIIAGTLEAECTCANVAKLNEALSELYEEKINRDPMDYPKVSAAELVQAMENCGMDSEKANETTSRITEVMKETDINLEILTRKTDTIETGAFKITAPMGNAKNIMTEERNGKTYLLIPADSVTTMNGIPIKL